MSEELSDRELLEMAARAAGIKIDKSPYNGGGANNTGFDCMGNAVLDWHNRTIWNPFADDGDKYRLASKLGMTIDFLNGEVWFTIPGCRKRLFFAPGNETEEARAIVRAAAEIGKSMMQEKEA